MTSARIASYSKFGDLRLPAQYFRLLEAGAVRIMELLNSGEDTLAALEAQPGCRQFGSAVLAMAVLYAYAHPANESQGKAERLRLAQRVGDLLAREQAARRFTTRLNHHRDTYMWLEAYRLLEPDLGEERRAAWRQGLLEQLTPLAQEVAKCRDYPRYQSPFISTSPNHYSLWASTLHLGGKVFGDQAWEALGAYVLHRFATEQAPDGYWGEHSPNGPTTGYDYLTVAAVALYWEHTGDPDALAALRRSTDFHSRYTYPDGIPVETINDRNRHWPVSMWGHFGFSHFPDGRRYAEFLTHVGTENAEALDLEAFGRIAQNALYYHEGELAPIPTKQPSYAHQMQIPAGIRKSGPWVVCLSGLIDTPTTSRWYLDRQGHVSVFHEKTGLIITGANSKHQPELATFRETIRGQVIHVPTSSRLEMNDVGDRLALAYNSFFAELEVPPTSGSRLSLRFRITPTGTIREARLALQLVLHAGEEIETATGQKTVLGEAKLEWGQAEHGGWVRHHGWTLRLPPDAVLTWPHAPFSPYADGPEAGLRWAVGTATVPLAAEGQEFEFHVEVE